MLDLFRLKVLEVWQRDSVTGTKSSQNLSVSIKMLVEYLNNVCIEFWTTAGKKWRPFLFDQKECLY